MRPAAPLRRAGKPSVGDKTLTLHGGAALFAVAVQAAEEPPTRASGLQSLQTPPARFIDPAVAAAFPENECGLGEVKSMKATVKVIGKPADGSCVVTCTPTKIQRCDSAPVEQGLNGDVITLATDPLGGSVALTGFVVNIAPEYRLAAGYAGFTIVAFMTQSKVDALLGQEIATRVSNAVS